jgi:regulator of cell morphogenesis and NO signaling
VTGSQAASLSRLAGPEVRVKVHSSQTVSELAIDCPGLVPFFEELGIDYCCRGNRSLLEACDSVGVDADDWLASLGELDENDIEVDGMPGKQLNRAKLTALTGFIVTVHQRFEQRELVLLGARIVRARKRYADDWPVISRIEHLFRRLSETLRIHIHQEERDLFQRIEQMENALASRRRKPLRIEKSLTERIMIEFLEHDVVNERLRTMRMLTGDWTLPTSAPKTLRTLWRDLKSFDRNLQRHIHLENNVLYPRAIAMESGSKRAENALA